MRHGTLYGMRLMERLRREREIARMQIETFVVFLGVLALLLPLEFLMFAVQDFRKALGHTFFSPETPWDKHIPFWPDWVWPYWLYFLLLGLCVWIPRNRRELASLVGGYMFNHLVGFGIFFTFPSAIERIEITCDSLSCNMVGALYLLDPGYGVFPSLHVAMSVYLTRVCFTVGHRLRWLVGVLGGAIILSTIFVKQHYLVDVPAGALLGYLGTHMGGKFALWLDRNTRLIHTEREATRWASAPTQAPS